MRLKSGVPGYGVRILNCATVEPSVDRVVDRRADRLPRVFGESEHVERRRDDAELAAARERSPADALRESAAGRPSSASPAPATRRRSSSPAVRRACIVVEQLVVEPIEPRLALERVRQARGCGCRRTARARDRDPARTADRGRRCAAARACPAGTTARRGCCRPSATR